LTAALRDGPQGDPRRRDDYRESMESWAAFLPDLGTASKQSRTARWRCGSTSSTFEGSTP